MYVGIKIIEDETKGVNRSIFIIIHRGIHRTNPRQLALINFHIMKYDTTAKKFAIFYIISRIASDLPAATL